MSRDPRLFLEDIVESGRRIMEYTAGLRFDAFCADHRTFDAVARNLEVIGEAAKRVPAAVRDQHPEVPWSEMARFRDVLSHAYFGVSEEIVWDVVQNELPKLVPQIESILAQGI